MKYLLCEASCYSRPFVHRDNEKESRKNGDIDRTAAGMLTDYLKMSDVKSGSTGQESGGNLRLFEPKIKKTDTAENRHVCQMFVGKHSFLFWVKTGVIPALQGKSAEFWESLFGFPYAVTIFSASWSFSSSTASSRILYFRIFPAAFMGKASTKRK